MLIDVYMEDPEFLAEPLSTQFTWAYSPHLELISAPCNAENARRFLERLRERRQLADLCCSPWAFEVPEYPEEGHSALESG